MDNEDLINRLIRTQEQWEKTAVELEDCKKELEVWKKELENKCHSHLKYDKDANEIVACYGEEFTEDNNEYR
jgi:hypothetical protein